MTQDTQKQALDATQKFLVLYRYIRRYARKQQCAGVRGRDLVTLRYLHQQGRVPVGRIREYLFMSLSTTSELVKRLEQAGYVKRQRSTTDSRVVYVELTPKGAEIAEQPPTGGLPLLRERMKTLAPDRLARLDAAMSDLIEMMEIDSDEFT